MAKKRDKKETKGTNETTTKNTNKRQQKQRQTREFNIVTSGQFRCFIDNKTEAAIYIKIYVKEEGFLPKD